MFILRRVWRKISKEKSDLKGTRENKEREQGIESGALEAGARL